MDGLDLTILGTCSGTEPIAGHFHTALAIESGGSVYWFDAGEGCSYRGHLAGLDLLRIRSIFISHPHLDHVGGLANLLWNIRKLNSRTDDPLRRLTGKTIHLYFPDMDVWAGVETLVGESCGVPKQYELDVRSCADGLLYADANLRVIALHNRHMGEPAQGQSWKSYSFRIESGDRAIVFSGDVLDVSELEPILGRCDLLLMETGHHRVETICAYLRRRQEPVAQLGFLHHGRAILANGDAELAKARAILGSAVFIAQEGQRLHL